MSINHPCPRFNRCRASFCPLTMEGKHEEGKAICAYLRWKVKGEPLPEAVAATLHDNLPRVIADIGDIRRRLKRAAQSPKAGANLSKPKVSA